MTEWLEDQTRRLKAKSIPLEKASAELDAGLAVYQALEEHLQKDRQLAEALSKRVTAAIR